MWVMQNEMDAQETIYLDMTLPFFRAFFRSFLRVKNECDGII